jgi:hypothetical protein
MVFRAKVARVNLLGGGGMAGDKQVLQDAYAAFAEGDVQTLLAPFDVFGPDTAAFQAFGIDVKEVLEDGATVVVLGALTSSSGEAPLETPFAHAYTMKNGKAVAFRDYTGSAAWVHAVAEEEEQPGDRPLGYPRRG